jgi:hypothetical protein
MFKYGKLLIIKYGMPFALRIPETGFIKTGGNGL